MTNEDSVLQQAMDNLREVVYGGVGAPGVLVDVVLLTEEQMERTTTEHVAGEG